MNTNTCFIRNARIYHTASRSFSDGSLLVENGRITALYPADATPPAGVPVYDACGRRVIPGLVDVHTHGRAGGDFVTADVAQMRVMAKSYLDSGVTTVLPTLASAPLAELEGAIDRINALADEGCGAHIAGIHLEGRYLNPAKRGAHAPTLLSALDPDELSGLLDRMKGAKHISAALELDESGEFLARALESGALAFCISGAGPTLLCITRDKNLQEKLAKKLDSITTEKWQMLPLHIEFEGARVIAAE